MSSRSKAARMSTREESCRSRLDLLGDNRAIHRFSKWEFPSYWYWRTLRYTSPSLESFSFEYSSMISAGEPALISLVR